MNRTSFVSIIVVVLLVCTVLVNARMLIPMDDSQTDHLKAYGLVYGILQKGSKVFWLLNYRGGSFVTDDEQQYELDAQVKGVSTVSISPTQYAEILNVVDNSNMEKVTLEKAPRIAVYTPPNKLPWDDAVTLALTYAEIEYDKIYDREVLTGKLGDYDWLHLHHEDFTGQYSKFYRSFSTTVWYQRQKMELEAVARGAGFSKVSDCKKAVALAIRKFIEDGGFVFAMCSATNTLDIALAAAGTDIVHEVYDGDGIDPLWRSKLNFGNCLAFENFEIQTDPMAGNHGNIDVCQVNTPNRLEEMDFVLFDFSAKLDPVPTMLTQCHRRTIRGFYGLLTTFNKNVLKKTDVILGYTPGTNRVKYLYGVVGKGQFAFYGGHDPEDFTHAVGDKPTVLELHKNSPGYRLILNNVLFPAAEKKEKKT